MKKGINIISKNITWILIAAFLFAVGIAIATVIPFDMSVLLEETPRSDETFQQTTDVISKIGELVTQTPVIGAIILFVNNLVAGLVAFIFGLMAGIPTVFSMLLNGFIVGSVSADLISQGAPVGFILAGLLPHGIPELFAIFICAGLGLKLGYHVILKPIGGGRRETFGFVWSEMKTVLPLVVVLLFVAAFIEVFATLPIVEYIFSP